MIGDISLGQFIPGNSFLHKLDPRSKLLFYFVFIVTIFFCNNYMSSVLMIISSAMVTMVSGIKARLYFKSMKSVMFVIVVTAILNLFYGTGTTVLGIGPIKITTGGIANSLFVVTRILSLMFISSAVTFTTSSNDLTEAIERLMFPLKLFKVDVHSIAMMMTIALRFVPTLLDETNKIMLAQKSRGADFETGKFTDRARALVPIFVPLFISSFRRAYDLAIAMECRCYQGGKGRTRMKSFNFSIYDFFGCIYVLTTCTGVILCSILLPKAY